MDSRRVLVSLMADTLQTNSEGRGDLSHVKRAAKVARRFPPPWTVEDNGAAFIVKDRNDCAEEIATFHL